MGTDQQEWTVLSMLKWATGYFESKGIPDARHSIEWLMAETLGVKRLDLYLLFERPLSPAELDELRPLVKRRAAQEPLQYITGFSAFINAHIAVNPGVLIPRLETEQLVEIILDDHPKDTRRSVLDIGTGSGCIPIALKMERPAWDLTAIDISEEALTTARQNAHSNNVKIDFKHGDISHHKNLDFRAGPSFDLIISNPPYILPDEKDTLEPQVKDHEPQIALFCEDIEKMYENIIAFSARSLKPKGQLYLEINERYANQLLACFASRDWHPSLLKDYAKKPRFIRAELLK